MDGISGRGRGGEKKRDTKRPEVTHWKSSHWAGQQVGPQSEKENDLASEEVRVTERATMQSTHLTGFRSA